MEINEIEHKIACGEMTGAQVFTQMKQHITSDSNIKYKACRTCGETKVLGLFYNHHMYKDGHDPVCETCRKSNKKKKMAGLTAPNRSKSKFVHVSNGFSSKKTSEKG